MSDEHDMLARIDRRLPGPMSDPTPDPRNATEVADGMADQIAETVNLIVWLAKPEAAALLAERACLLAIKDAAARFAKAYEAESFARMDDEDPRTIHILREETIEAHDALSPLLNAFAALPEDQTP